MLQYLYFVFKDCVAFLTASVNRGPSNTFVLVQPLVQNRLRTRTPTGGQNAKRIFALSFLQHCEETNPAAFLTSFFLTDFFFLICVCTLFSISFYKVCRLFTARSFDNFTQSYLSLRNDLDTESHKK